MMIIGHGFQVNMLKYIQYSRLTLPPPSVVPSVFPFAFSLPIIFPRAELQQKKGIRITEDFGITSSGSSLCMYCSVFFSVISC